MKRTTTLFTALVALAATLGTPALAVKYDIRSNFTSIYAMEKTITSDTIGVTAYNCQARVTGVIAYAPNGLPIYMYTKFSQLTYPDNQYTSWGTGVGHFYRVSSFQVLLSGFQPAGDCRLEVEPWEY